MGISLGLHKFIRTDCFLSLNQINLSTTNFTNIINFQGKHKEEEAIKIIFNLFRSISSDIQFIEYNEMNS